MSIKKFKSTNKSKSQTQGGLSILNDGLNESIMKLAPKVRRKLLGQVFTPSWVADYMAGLCIKTPDQVGIDPCFGKGIFITTIAKRLLNLNRGDRIKAHKNIRGVEIDPDLFLEGIENYKRVLKIKGPLDNLVLGNFFDYDIGLGELDFAIMNPPYVRHEELNSEELPKELSKEKIISSVNTWAPKNIISMRSNLYVYFFLHLTRFLKNGGKLVAITYNSWLYTNYGKGFQKFLLDNFKIKFIIDFDKETFDDAIIGSCIVVLEKCPGEKRKRERDKNITHFVRLKTRASVDELLLATEAKKNNSTAHRFSLPQKQLYNDQKWEKFFYVPDFHREIAENRKMVTLGRVAKIWRGLDTKANKFFVLTQQKVDHFMLDRGSLTPFLKVPKDLNTWKTSDWVPRTFLLTTIKAKNDGQARPEHDKLMEYVRYIEESVKRDPAKHKGLARLIKKGEGEWYNEKPKPPGDLIFSYIIRRNKYFYINDARVPTSGNFHNIKSGFDVYCLFAILNSTLTKYLLEVSGRTQGSGLLKLQVYELAELKVPDPEQMPADVYHRLSKLGHHLSKLSKKGLETEKILRKIDDEILEYLELRHLAARIKAAEKNIMESRLNKKTPKKG